MNLYHMSPGLTVTFLSTDVDGLSVCAVCVHWGCLKVVSCMGLKYSCYRLCEAWKQFVSCT